MLEFEGELEVNVDDIKVSDGMNYLYCVRVHADTELRNEFLYGAPGDTGSGSHHYKDRYLRCPKDLEKGELTVVV